MAPSSRQAPQGGHPVTGLFVVLEGGDSVGKTTQARCLDRWLDRAGVSHLLTREPGDTAVGARIRSLLLDPASGAISPKAEALLYNADRAQHLDEVVRPALSRGQMVICDRYVDSTLAYQGAGRVLEAGEIASLARWATDGLRPDLTILLDADPAETTAKIVDKDRLEAESLDFHRRVRAEFLRLAGTDPEHYLVLAARDSRESIAAAIRHRLAPLLGSSEELSDLDGIVAP
ncbi:dTMP kinase [Acidipropionibacterium jensenii]|uniref:dTMP kinase n=1 Tax=Acidipropionibacterium jensenii TaxID=1749 RepID=UPI003B82EF07